MVCFNSDDDAPLGSIRIVKFFNSWVLEQDASNLYDNYAHVFIVPLADSIQLCVWEDYIKILSRYSHTYAIFTYTDFPLMQFHINCFK
jgi:hypothetical protein